MTYHLTNNFNTGRTGYYPTVVVVGTGGTGGYVAEYLCRLVYHKTDIILVDMDWVEEANLVRQNFFPDEIGMFKSEALAKRLSTKYNRPVSYSTRPIEATEMPIKGLIIGCVDNGPARAEIAKKEETAYWWVDVGNGENYGQILIGNAGYAEFNEKEQVCYNLPLPTIQRPELLQQAPPVPQLNCEANTIEQGPTINLVMASLTIEVVKQLFRGTCPWMQLLVDMDHGTTKPVMADPGIVKRLIKNKSKYAVRMRGK